MEDKFLEIIRRLMFKSIRYEHYIGNITISELHFMARCLIRYYWYYRICCCKGRR